MAIILFTAFFMLNNVMAVIVAQYADAAKRERDRAARSADDQDNSESLLFHCATMTTMTAKLLRDQAARSADDQDKSKSPAVAVAAAKPTATAAADPQQRECDELGNERPGPASG